MKLFVTGSTGFIGRHLLSYLETINEIEICLLISPDKDYQTDLHHVISGRLESISEWREDLIEWQPDACIHLAWYAEPGKYLYSDKNIDLLKHSLDLMRVLIEAQCQSVVMVGTVAEYDTSVGYLHETSKTQPATIYAASKLSLAHMAERMALDAGINFVWARMFYLYGPQEYKSRLVPALINTLLQKTSFDTTKGRQVRDYLHVMDAAQALWHLVKTNQSGIFNVCSGYPITIRDLVIKIAAMLDAEYLVNFGAIEYRKWEPMFICGDNRKLQETGWKPHFNLESGIHQTITWWKRQQ